MLVPSGYSRSAMLNVLGGRVTYQAVAQAHELDYTPLDDALALSA